jgi:hypothetical protein
MKSFTAIMIMLMLVGCAPIPINTAWPRTNQPGPNGISAIYLVQNQGQLAASDLQSHPEVMVTHSFDEFKQHSRAKVALWIDKNAVSLVNMDWLHQAPQKYYPLALVGYNDALYSFRETLAGFPILGPAVDWSSATLEPGFSVWMIRKETSSSLSTYMKGFAQPSTVDAILTITNALLKSGPPK